MASPSLAPQAMALDPRAKGRFTLQLGEGITNRGSAKRKFSAIQFNHKPARPDGSARTTQIESASTNSNRSTLKITDSSDGTYTYVGQRRDSSKSSYVLMFDPSKQTCTLEPLSSSFTFNLQSTPNESSAATLNKKFPLIHVEDGGRGQGADGDLFGEGTADDGLDPNNPFDYRHFLNQREERPSSGPPSPLAERRIESPALSTALAKPERVARSTPKVQAKQPKPKYKISQIAKKARGAKAKPATTITVPSVHLERRASTQPGPTTKRATVPAKSTKAAPKSAEFVHSSSSSPETQPTTSTTLPPTQEEAEEREPTSTFDGGLEIDFGDDGPPRRKRGDHSSLLSSAAAELAAAAHNGPISLRSAANSPGGSRVGTPRHRQRTQRRRPIEVEELDLGDAGGDALEIDLGEAPHEVEEEEEGYVEDNESDEDDVAMKDYSAQQTRSRADTMDNSNAQPYEEEEDAEGEDDVDVEPMTLGSPAQHVQQQQNQEEEDEDDMDMEAAFEAEMMQGLQDDEDESDVSEAE